MSALGTIVDCSQVLSIISLMYLVSLSEGTFRLVDVTISAQAVISHNPHLPTMGWGLQA